MEGNGREVARRCAREERGERREESGEERVEQGGELTHHLENSIYGII
jgi:hypothetical protein